MTTRIQVQREARRGEIIEVRIVIQTRWKPGFATRFAGPPDAAQRHSALRMPLRRSPRVFRAAMGAGHRR